MRPAGRGARGRSRRPRRQEGRARGHRRHRDRPRRRAADRRGGPGDRAAAAVRGRGAGRRVPRHRRHPGRRGRAGPAPDRPADRPGRRVRGVEFPLRVLRRRRGHGVRAGRRVPGRGQGARGPPGHLRRVRRDRDRGTGGRRGPSRDVRPGARGGSGAAAAAAPADRGGRVHRVDGRRPGPGPGLRPVPIPCFGELGSVNPCVVLPGAAFSRPAAVATGYTGSLTLGTGQFCTNPGLLFVPEDVGLLTAIAEAAGAAAGGAMLSGRIFAGYQDAVAEAADHPGLTELAEGQPGPGPWGATPRVFQVALKEFAGDLAVLSRERFGPAGLVITYPSVEELLPVLASLAGNLVGTVHVDTGSAEDMELARQVVAVLERVAGRVVCNGWPTGVAVVAAQNHGGPWPATTAPAYTSVGTAAIRRWLVPVAYQDFTPELLPLGLR